MTETTNKYEEFVTEYIQGMKDGNTELLAELPNKLETAEEKRAGLSALLEAVDKESDEFKADNEALITALTDTLNLMNAVDSNTEESSEAATEDEAATEAVSEEAVEPAAEDSANK